MDMVILCWAMKSPLLQRAAYQFSPTAIDELMDVDWL